MLPHTRENRARFVRHEGGYGQAMLSGCTAPGCTTLVFGGGACVMHQLPTTRTFVRGRPFVQVQPDSLTWRAAAASPASELVRLPSAAAGR